jgi:hypothetical protein
VAKERLELALDQLVELADGAVVLGRGRDPRRRRLSRGAWADELRAVGERRTRGTLDIEEMLERVGIEWGQAHGESRGVVSRRHGEVGSIEMRRAADEHEQVVHQGEVRHFLQRHAHHRVAPARNRRRLRRGEALLHAALHAERRIQIGAQKVVLDLGGFRQEVDELFAQPPSVRQMRVRVCPAKGPCRCEVYPDPSILSSASKGLRR